jgi:alkylation response protein AidB-like acyl-CoA dehydrogenase
LSELDVGRIRELARTRLRPLVAQGEPGRVNRRLIRALGEHGILPQIFPAGAGGAASGEISARDLCLVREALARESAEIENALAIQALGAYPLLLAEGNDPFRRLVGDAAQGSSVPAFAMTEPGAGSDARAMTTTAEVERDGFRISGEKTFISNAPDADWYVLFARTARQPQGYAITAFLVHGDAAGLRGTPIRLLSSHPIGRLELDGVLVSQRDVIGRLHDGFRLAMRTLDLFRPSVGAMTVGLAHAALDLAISHAETRTQFGRPIRDFQAVSHLLAEMATRLRAARLLVYDAAGAYDRGEDGIARRSAMAKLFATETAQQVVDAAIQVVGAAALEEGHPLEHLYREVRAPRIYEGTSEIQREIIARDLFRTREPKTGEGSRPGEE